VAWLVEVSAGTAPGGGLRSDADPYRLRGLADLLAEAPLCFSHREAGARATEGLDACEVVVLTTQAASRGAITRQALLDYVSRGGGLLILATREAEETERALARWFSPIGVELDVTSEVQGVFQAGTAHPLARFWGNFRITNGARLTIADSSAIVVPNGAGPDGAVFAAGTYGNGRIALLAAATPLETPALANGPNRVFAQRLFAWLAEAGQPVDDVDGDGLQDGVEDKNGNGAVDPGETDRFNPDTDGDGIPDGVEDRNRNGRVDAGETSPLLPDTDGDGAWDGTDLDPAN
jgi:hypothetical protein